MILYLFAVLIYVGLLKGMLNLAVILLSFASRYLGTQAYIIEHNLVVVYMHITMYI